MACRTLLCASLLVLSQSALAQDRDADARLLTEWMREGVPATKNDGGLGVSAQRILDHILFRPPDQTLLYAYSSAVVCNGNDPAVLGHEGLAAVLVTGTDDSPYALAIYRPSVPYVAADASLLWCRVNGWSLATTQPIEGRSSDGIYIVGDVEEVRKRLSKFSPSDDQEDTKNFLLFGGAPMVDDDARIEELSTLLANAQRRE